MEWIRGTPQDSGASEHQQKMQGSLEKALSSAFFSGIGNGMSNDLGDKIILSL